MRIFGYAFVAVALVATLASSLHGQARDATRVLAAAREALGGENHLTGVKTFVATGRTRQLRGNNLVPIEFEISCELPDKFVRHDEIPAQDTDPTLLGFNGDVLIQFPPPPAGRGPGRAGEAPPPGTGRAVGAPPAVATPRGGAPSAADGGRGTSPLSPAQQRLVSAKQDFVRLTLGMFATSFSTYPLTFAYVGEGEAPQGKADVLDVSGPANFSARLIVHRDTHLPVMVTWQLPATNVMVRVPGQPLPDVIPPGTVLVDAPVPPGETVTQDERDKYASTIVALRRQALAQAKPIENRVYYSDYRDVEGLKLPFRLRRAVAGETIEETTFDRFRINAKISTKTFEVPK